MSHNTALVVASALLGAFMYSLIAGHPSDAQYAQQYSTWQVSAASSGNESWVWRIHSQTGDLDACRWAVGAPAPTCVKAPPQPR